LILSFRSTATPARRAAIRVLSRRERRTGGGWLLSGPGERFAGRRGSRCRLNKAAAGFPAVFAASASAILSTGFCPVANAGLRIARERRHDALLLNSDTLVFPLHFRNMPRGVSRPMIGFLSRGRTTHHLLAAPPGGIQERPAGGLPRVQAARAPPEEFQFVPARWFLPFHQAGSAAEFGVLDEHTAKDTTKRTIS